MLIFHITVSFLCYALHFYHFLTFEAGARVRAKVSNVLLLETIESEHF